MIKILKYSEIDKNDLFLRDIAVTRVGGAVADIIDNVRSGGDRALLDYALKFDKAELSGCRGVRS